MWEPAPPSPRAEGAAVELTPKAGTEPPAAGSLVEVPAGTAEAPAGALEVPPALEKEEAGLLQFEVGSISSRTPLILGTNRSSLPFIPLLGHRRPSPTLRLRRR
jgi:hypothetical protein